MSSWFRGPQVAEHSQAVGGQGPGCSRERRGRGQVMPDFESRQEFEFCSRKWEVRRDGGARVKTRRADGRRPGGQVR